MYKNISIMRSGDYVLQLSRGVIKDKKKYISLLITEFKREGSKITCHVKLDTNEKGLNMYDIRLK